jgi:PKD repeat protein
MIKSLLFQHIWPSLFVLILFSGLYSSGGNSESIEKNNLTSHYVLAPNGSISGTTTVCQNEMPLPLITFTGSGGSTPYTFTYTINGGGNNTISTTGNNDSIDLAVSTNTLGTFIYQLVSVEDDDGDVTNENGTATITVTERPQVSFSYNNNTCSGDSVTFTSNVTGSNPFIYSWNFGDGSTSSATNPSHVFTALGCGVSNFTVTLIVTDTNGCINSASNVITVLQRPDISFIDLDATFSEPFNNCNASDPEYTINVGNNSGSTSCITSYDIDWGDGNLLNNVTFPLTHTYTQLGSFNMVITASGNNGCSSTVNYLIKNSSNPIGSLKIPGGTVDLCIPVAPIVFAIGSWGSNPPDTVYNIDYGDGTILVLTQTQLESSTFFNSSDPDASQNYPIPHTYTDSNCPDSNYTVILTIVTSCGESVLTAGPITIFKKPDVNFEVDPIVCVDTAVQFTNTTTGGYNQGCTTNSLSYWDFGDGNTSNDDNPIHTYTTSGNYTVTLYAENSCGTTDPVTKPICVEPELIPSFDLNTNNGCSPLEILTTNTTDTSQSCGGDTYLWEVFYTSDFCGTAPETWQLESV